MSDKLTVLRDSIDFLPDATFVIADNGIVIAWNRAIEEMTGVKKEDIVGKGDHVYAVPFYGEPRPMVIDFIFGHGSEVKDKYIVIEKKGEGFYAEAFTPYLYGGKGAFLAVSASPLFNDQRMIIGAIESIRDITKHKKMEEALRAAHEEMEVQVQKRTAELEKVKKEAEAASIIKSAFLANMSHEIRTPLNAITGFSELLEKTPLDYVQKDYVSVIWESSQMLLALINNILDLSKIEAGEMHLEYIDFDLEYLIRGVIKMNGPKLEGKNVELFCAMDETMPKNFKGDPTRIRQILLNLLSNAIKFTEQGSIKIAVWLREPEGKKEDKIRTVAISVKDTGIGIPNHMHQSIFGAFEQADFSTTRKYGGTGLGLTISRFFVEMMGGKIWVESEPGKGSEFFVTLKLEEASPAATKDIIPLKTEELKGKTVIIVDDSESALRILEDYCSEFGMVVLLKAQSCHEALQWLAEHTELPDIVIADIIMQGISGYDLAKKIKSDNKTRDSKMIAVTADVRPGGAKKAQDAGFDAFLPKPIIKGDFIRILQTTMGDRRPDKNEGGQIVTRHLAEELACKGVRVLVAEDNVVNQKFLKIVLKNMGCEVDLALNGRIAVEKVRSRSYDLVLMDLQMPVMGGCEAVRIIRSEISQTLPIVAVTAAAMKEDEEKSRAAGMNDYLTKPVELHKLKEKIMQWSKRTI